MRSARTTRSRVLPFLRPVLSLALCAGVASCVSLGDELPPSATTGPAIYAHLCRKCHGVAGWGDGPQAQWQYLPATNFHASSSRLKSDEQLIAVIEHGVIFSPMHSFRGTLSNTEIQDVVAYIRLLSQRSR